MRHSKRDRREQQGTAEPPQQALGAVWTERRYKLVVLPIVLALTLGLAAGTAAAKEKDGRDERSAFVPDALVAAAKEQPKATFRVIVQGRGGTDTGAVATEVADAEEPARSVGAVRKRFRAVNAVAAELTGKELVRLAAKKRVLAITEDVQLVAAGFSNKQQWPYVSGVAKFWPKAADSSLQAPTIAIVDSGVAGDRSDFGGRLLGQVSLVSGSGVNSPGDGRGHGTFVASIAAGGAPGYAGAAPNAKLVSIDVVDDAGSARTSDVIAAADWILQHKDVYGIRVANFSLHSANPTSFLYDPLDRAVERLWFSGVVVVAAAGNYATGGNPTGVPFAPGNDPFVITVGAADIDGSRSVSDDFNAPWSAWGYTPDGFSKPDLGAPGRYMVGAVPQGASMYSERPERITAPGYMQISGTSFATPVVAGAAAYLLAVHPEWTPDQVKGALMLTAKTTPEARLGSLGVGEVSVARAVDVSSPPNPNLGLIRFVAADPAGGAVPVFDAAAWTSVARADTTWNAATWTSAAWTSAAWTSAAWTSAAWTSAAWTSATWTSNAVTDAAWTSSSLSDATYLSNAEDDVNAEGGYAISAEELALAEAELGLSTPPGTVVGP